MKRRDIRFEFEISMSLRKYCFRSGPVRRIELGDSLTTGVIFGARSVTRLGTLERLG